MKGFYNFGYRYLRMPYDTRRPKQQLVRLVESGQLAPCRCLELACGPGTDAIYLAQHGFEVTAIDFAEAGIALARKRAARAGVEVDWRVDDVTALATVHGSFDLILDCGSLSDLSVDQRTRAYQVLDGFLRPGVRFFIWCFEWEPVWYERWFFRTGGMSFGLTEIEDRFAERFDIEVLDRRRGGPFRGFGCYLMTQTSG